MRVPFDQFHERVNEMKGLVPSTVLVIGILSSAMASADETGTIHGLLVDPRNQVKAAGKAAVFVCDPETGYPLLAKTRKPLTIRGAAQGIVDFWHVVTDLDGSFEIGDVPPGTYRLVAQSWLGIEGVPGQKNTSEVVFLHGSSHPVEVRAGEKAMTGIRALGKGVLHVEFDPPAGGAFLFVSTAPMLGDPVLSYLGWGEDFLKNTFGMTHIAGHRVTILGLPEDREVSIASLHYDNIPGSGGGRFKAGRDAVARISVYAGWSDGKDEPPAELLPFVEYLEEHKPSLPEIMGLGTSADFQNERGHLDRRKLWDSIQDNAGKVVTIEDIGKVRVIDLAAADVYCQLRSHHKEQRDRQKK
jgi:hypothetical protein